MLKSNCICIILVIVAICIIAVIFIFCFCSKKNNYSRIGGGRIRGGDVPDFDKLRSLIREINDINWDEMTDVIDKVNKIENLSFNISLFNKYIKEIIGLFTSYLSPDFPDKKRKEALTILDTIQIWYLNTGITNLESENESLKDRIKDLEKAPSGSKIADLESENSRLRNRISELENDNDLYGNTRNPYQIDAS